ncbi:hypothetical protein F2Q69_00034707 [Brassica cretica]|uniref:Uncharacterized protein n=1 Tax=Brassica cretica TaxID=69181 RepID=A0A8S9SPP7_BRACR|nr:hypothetical protein F2Q69_00034707 [Brassica cretica]
MPSLLHTHHTFELLLVVMACLPIFLASLPSSWVESKHAFFMSSSNEISLSLACWNFTVAFRSKLDNNVYSLSDAPRIEDPGQDSAQLDPNEVTPSDPADCDVYRIDPQTSGMELRLDPRPDNGTDQPT